MLLFCCTGGGVGDSLFASEGGVFVGGKVAISGDVPMPGLASLIALLFLSV